MAIKFFEEGGNHMTKCKVIALANQKGGTAKTTTTLNLGIGLAHQGRKVLLVDADPQGDLTTALGWTDADNLPITLETQMKKILQDEPFVYNEGILHHEEGVDIIPTNIELSGMEISLVNAMSREQTLKLYLADLKKDYDYILIDCMPSLGMLTINALAAADSVIVPVQAHYLPLKGMTQLMNTIGKVQRQLNPNLKIAGVLLTLADMRTKLALIAYRKQNGDFYMARATLVYYETCFHRKYDIERIQNHVVYWDIEQQGWRTFQIENFLEWKPVVN